MQGAGQVFVFLTAGAIAMAVFQAYFVLSRNPKARENRLFACLSLLIAVWGLGMIGLAITPADDKATAIFWFRVAAADWALLTPLALHFMTALTRADDQAVWRWVRNLAYLPAPILTYYTVVDRRIIPDLRHVPMGWAYVAPPDTFWMLINNVFMVCCLIPAVFLLWRWGRRTSNPLHLRQARIIGLSMSVALVGFFLLTYIQHIFGAHDMPSVEHLIMWIWIGGIGYAMSRHRLMTLTPAAVAPDILAMMADGFLLLNRDGLVTNANRAAAALTGQSEHELLGKHIGGLLPDTPAGSFLEQLRAKEQLHDFEMLCTKKDGTTVPVSLSAGIVRLKAKEQGGVVIVLRDISERKRTEERLRFLATHDVLTRLPNRMILQDRFRQATARARRYGTKVALLLADLDRFKRINDRMGHDAGDLVLQTVAQRLAGSVRECDTVVRIGGNEFVVLLTDLAGEKGAEVAIARLKERFAKPIPVEAQEVHVTMSIGVSFFPAHGDNIEDLMRCADQALYRVKETERGSHAFYTAELQSQQRKGTRLEDEMRRALEATEFELHYQPIYDLDSGILTCLEALVRWRHPEHGLMPPMAFIPAAEKSGFIVPLGEWVLATACRQLREWRSCGRPDLRMAVNVSARQFCHPGFLACVERVLKETGVEARALEVEITETTAILEVERSVELIRKLRMLGASVIIDDFGFGYSSLTCLKLFEVNTIKIDRFFIQHVNDDPRDAAIVRAIIALAHSLGIRVVAEGVETEAQLEFLRSLRWNVESALRCDMVQGFLFARPTPPADITPLLSVPARVRP